MASRKYTHQTCLRARGNTALAETIARNPEHSANLPTGFLQVRAAHQAPNCGKAFPDRPGPCGRPIQTQPRRPAQEPAPVPGFASPVPYRSAIIRKGADAGGEDRASAFVCGGEFMGGRG